MASRRIPSETAPRILVVRPDRIGDVILSTPVLTALREAYPGSRITFMVRELVAPLLRGLPEIDDVFVYDPEGRHRGVRGFFRLMEELKGQNFQIAVVLQTQLKVAAALYGVGVPHRLGPLSKLHSFFFYNRGTRQHRSLVEMHEADYNLQLLRKLGIRVASQTLPTRASVSEERREWAKDWLLARGWDASKEDHAMLVAVHPGMGGSALNWPEPHYVELIRMLRQEGNQVLVTGGPGEGTLLGRIEEELRRQGESALFYGGPGAGVVDCLAALFEQASVVVAPSTGPMHVAVALGKPVVTFFPPIRVQSAIRWGPYSPDAERASVLVPEVYCGMDFHCRGSECNYFPCMKGITPRQAVEEVHRQMTVANQIAAAEKAAIQAQAAESTASTDESAVPGGEVPSQPRTPVPTGAGA